MTKRGGAIAMPAVAIALFLALAWAHRFSVDDAFINYRVVHQVEGGHGPVFNIGERVEVTTSALWLAVLVAADELSPLRLEWTALVVEVALGAAGLAAAMAGAVRLAEPHEAAPRACRTIVPVGALAYLAPVAAWDFATGGLETGLVLAWIGTSFWAGVGLLAPRAAREPPPTDPSDPTGPAPAPVPAAGRPRPRRLRWRLVGVVGAAALVGSGVLVRPDLIVVCAGLAVPVGVAAWRAGRWRGLAWAAGAAVAVPAVVEVLRMGYYGQLLPNTVYAKEGMRSAWGQGWRYLANFAGPYVLAVPVAIVAAWLIADRRADRGPERRDRALVIGAVEGAAVAYALAVVRVGGDYMHGRLLLAAWLTLLLPVAAVPLPALRARRATWATAALAAWAAVAAVALRPPPGSLFTPRVAPLLALAHARGIGASGVMDARAATRAWAGKANPVTSEELTRGLTLAGFVPGRDLFEPQRYPPGPGELPVHPGIGTSVTTATSLGAWSYRIPLDVWVVDRLGLADPVTARVALEWRATPGHEKVLPSPWIAAEYVADDHPVADPSRFVVLDFSTSMLVGVDVNGTAIDPAGFARDRAAARAALACGALRERVWDVRAPLTPGRFVGNALDAVRLDRFRFPADPEAARRRLCGRG